MPFPATDHIGSRVRIARNAAGLSQVELADFLDRSESWMASIEAGRLQLDRYSIIHAIAEQCDVDVVWLLGQPYRLRRGGGALAHAHVPAIRTGLRRSSLILSGHPGLAPHSAPPNMQMMRGNSTEANRERQAADLPGLATRLPAMVEDLNAALLTTDGPQRDEVLRLLVDATRTARMCLNQLGYPDLAWASAEVAAGAATLLDDPLLKAEVAWDRCGAMLHQSSLLDAVVVADAALRDLEPIAASPQAPEKALSLRGALHLRCAVAFARGTRSDDAWARIGAALEDTDRLGPGFYDVDSHTVFGRGTVAVHAAEVGVEVGQPDAGLNKVPDADWRDVPSKERRVHYQIDEARALHRMGQSGSAVVKLRAAASSAPAYVFGDPMARAAVADMAVKGVPSQASQLAFLVRNMELVH
ncbi:helix-turn-helix domain-containing protein [Streptomyces sp. NPDC047315]|uniref:helix-turn-helix domain-containing protein n=1 Tax=Streptomyces sp. NPDC047315 TaxID=3155142 RepID=UPI0033FCBF0E